MDVNRRVAALAVVAALSLAGPLAAAGPENPVRRGSAVDFLSGGILTRFLVWLGVTPVPEAALKSPGEKKSESAESDEDSSTTPGTTMNRGASIDPDGVH